VAAAAQALLANPEGSLPQLKALLEMVADPDAQVGGASWRRQLSGWPASPGWRPAAGLLGLGCCLWCSSEAMP
jgi:hypothetical protein